MTLSHTTKLYAVSDCRISKLTADPTGGSPTYSASIDVPGIKQVGIGGNVKGVELRGDNTLLDANSTLDAITLQVSHAKISLDALAVMLGGTVTDAGTTPNQTSTYLLTSAATFSYWKLEAKTPTNGADTVGGDVHMVAHKCILTDFPNIGFAEEDYRIVSFNAIAVPLLSTTNWFSIVANETAAVIS